MATAILPTARLHQRPAFRAFLVIRALDELNAQMLNVGVAWYVYSATGNPMSLAYAGLARFLPNAGVALVAGQAADRFDRRRVLWLSTLVQAVCALTFAAITAGSSPRLPLLYTLVVLLGAAQALGAPAMSALLPRLVAGEELPQSVAVASSAFQISSLAGPAVGGVLYAVSAPGMFLVSAAMFTVALAQVRALKVERSHSSAEEHRPADNGLLSGLRYVRSKRLLLGAISLDLFAVLLGGVTALLPIFAKDILAVGPIGLGCLRCAPGAGAALTGLLLARRPINRAAGKLMLACVAGFGLATVIFSLSANIWLSLFALAALGGFDMVSMVIRQTLVQVSTPDSLRGRVSAVQWVFIGASSELGEFESGVTAALFGTVPAALLGGLGTLMVVALWSQMFPELPRAERLTLDG